MRKWYTSTEILENTYYTDHQFRCRGSRTIDCFSQQVLPSRMRRRNTDTTIASIGIATSICRSIVVGLKYRLGRGPLVSQSLIQHPVPPLLNRLATKSRLLITLFVASYSVMYIREGTSIGRASNDSPLGGASWGRRDDGVVPASLLGQVYISIIAPQRLMYSSIHTFLKYLVYLLARLDTINCYQCAPDSIVNIPQHQANPSCVVVGLPDHYMQQAATTPRAHATD